MSIQSGQDIVSFQQFEIDGVAFATGFGRRGPSAFTVVKSLEMIDRYREVLAGFPRPRLVELGIAYGGSVALFSLIAEPERFLAVDLSPEPLAQLDEFIAERGLGDRVVCRYGVDQGDRAELARIVEDVFGDEPLDLVFDDASHLYHPTLASFEVLFPRLRPGGLYLIEDWKHEHQLALVIRRAIDDPTSEGHEAAMALLESVEPGRRPGPDVPLSRLALELVEAMADSDGVIADVRVHDQWIAVERGPAHVEGELRISDLAVDPFEQFTPRLA